MKMKRLYMSVLCTLCLFMSFPYPSAAGEKPADRPVKTVSVDTSSVEGRITPYLYGACIEDVNHEIYGGLYDQKIFGESFEEPAPSPVMPGFSSYEGEWTPYGDSVEVCAHPGAKLVYDLKTVSDGTVGADIRFTGVHGDNAGILVRVSGPGNGADAFFGYEISLSSDGKKVVVGKHKNNFTHLADVAVSCNPRNWNRLEAEMSDGWLSVLLNGETVYRTEDNDPDLSCGKAALRTWNMNAVFRNLSVDDGTEAVSPVFKGEPRICVSRQWQGFATGNAVPEYRIDTVDAFNGRNAQVIRFVSGAGKAGISNSGLNGWGISVREGRRMEGSLWLRNTGPGKTSVKVALADSGRTGEYAACGITVSGTEWKKYPVFYLDFAGVGDSYADVEETFDILICEKEGQYNSQNMAGRSLSARFAAVVKAAYKQDGPVVFLVDEYDKPLLGTTGAERERIRTLYKTIFGNLKGLGHYFRFAWLTGITKFAKVSVFSDLNQLNVLSMDKAYATLCGITQTELETNFAPEIDVLADEQGLTREACLDKLRTTYDGYRFHPNGERVYNPFSLIYAFNKKEFGAYWFESGTPSSLLKVLKKNVEQLRELPAQDRITVGVSELTGAYEDTRDPLTYLYQSGYLTIKSYDARRLEYTIDFPNDEVRYGFLTALIPYVTYKKIRQWQSAQNRQNVRRLRSRRHGVFHDVSAGASRRTAVP